MSRFALFAAAALNFGFAGATQAADLPTKAPPYEAPALAPGWTGFYVGGNLGELWTTQDAVWNPLPSPAAFTVLPVTGRLDSSGFVGGIQGGYNWQLAPTWVVGLEGDYSWTGAGANIQGVWKFFPSGQPSFPTTLSSLTDNLDSLASVRGRIGYLVTPNALAYVTGGAAWGRFDYSAFARNTANNYLASTSFSKIQSGFVVGGGLEWALTPNWLIRGEYLYYEFGGSSVVASASLFPDFPSGFVWHNTGVQEARLGLSYKFDWQVPAAGQYWAHN
ncbi:MAG TPA: outer membrane beta-barrel protein [Candidatus Acidoferrum sp.]